MSKISKTLSFNSLATIKTSGPSSDGQNSHQHSNTIIPGPTLKTNNIIKTASLSDLSKNFEIKEPVLLSAVKTILDKVTKPSNNKNGSSYDTNDPNHLKAIADQSADQQSPSSKIQLINIPESNSYAEDSSFATAAPFLEETQPDIGTTRAQSEGINVISKEMQVEKLTSKFQAWGAAVDEIVEQEEATDIQSNTGSETELTATKEKPKTVLEITSTTNHENVATIVPPIDLAQSSQVHAVNEQGTDSSKPTNITFTTTTPQGLHFHIASQKTKIHENSTDKSHKLSLTGITQRPMVLALPKINEFRSRSLQINSLGSYHEQILNIMKEMQQASAQRLELECSTTLKECINNFQIMNNDKLHLLKMTTKNFSAFRTPFTSYGEYNYDKHIANNWCDQASQYLNNNESKDIWNLCINANVSKIKLINQQFDTRAPGTLYPNNSQNKPKDQDSDATNTRTSPEKGVCADMSTQTNNEMPQTFILIDNNTVTSQIYKRQGQRTDSTSSTEQSASGDHDEIDGYQPPNPSQKQKSLLHKIKNRLFTSKNTNNLKNQTIEETEPTPNPNQPHTQSKSKFQKRIDAFNKHFDNLLSSVRQRYNERKEVLVENINRINDRLQAAFTIQRNTEHTTKPEQTAQSRESIEVEEQTHL